jgi:AcrR family transcriptional regulator
MKAERVNQKARTRAALVTAAGDLLRQGQPPSIAAAAAEAGVSLATAYRYFSNPEHLWAEASFQTMGLDEWMDSVHRRLEASDADVTARARLAAELVGGRMLADQRPFRELMRASMEQWLSQRHGEAAERAPVRASRRQRTNDIVLEPLRGRLTEDQLERLRRALTLVSGVDSIVVLTDSAGLDRDEALATLIDANRWLIAGALAEFEVATPRSAPRTRRPRSAKAKP